MIMDDNAIQVSEEVKQFVAAEFKRRFPEKKFIPGESLVSPSGKLFDEKELMYAIEAVLEGWWTDGKWNEKFEKKIADYIGVKFCTTVNSGSSANLVAFATLTSHLLRERRLKAGDEVITVATAFPTTINPIIIYRCIPVFVDVDIKTMQIDINKLEKAYSKKTKALFIAHTLGNTFNVKAIKEFCKKHHLWLIEDNCDALGSIYHGQRTGNFGDIATLSFYPAHHITTAEGGAVLTNIPLLNKIARSIRDWGRDCWCPTGKENTCKMRFKWNLGDLPEGYDHKYTYSHIGYNLKMTDLQAAIGLAQLEKVDKFIKIRKENYEKLKSALSEFNKHFTFMKPTANSDPSWFGFILTVRENSPFSREDLMKYLNDKKIGTRLVFAGNIIRQPYFINNNIKYRKVNDLKNSDIVMNQSFWIGIHPGITDDMIAYTKQVLEEFTKNYSQQNI